MNNVPHALVQFDHYVPCCTAKSKRTGKLCRQPAMKNGKCRLHGGKSTSAKTSEGKYNRDHANYKHGFCSRETKEELQFLSRLSKKLRLPR